MGVNGSVTSGSGKVLVLPVRDVEVRLGVAVLLGQTEVDDVDLVSTLANAHEEVVGLDITVNEGLGVDVLDTRNQLVGEQEDGLERELSVAEVEEVLQTGAKEVEDHGVVVTLGTEPADEGDANTASEGLVDSGLILELGVLGLDALELDGDLLSGDNVGAEVNITERTGTDLAADTVLVTDTEILKTNQSRSLGKLQRVRRGSSKRRRETGLPDRTSTQNAPRPLILQPDRVSTYHGGHLG